MLKRFNMFALIVLLVFQTMIAPIAATAQSIEHGDVNTETSEKLDSANTANVSVGDEETENLSSEADEESAEENVSGGVNEDNADEEAAQDSEKISADDSANDVNENEALSEDEASGTATEKRSEAEAEADAAEQVEEPVAEESQAEAEESTENIDTQTIEPQAEIEHNIFKFDYFLLNGEDIVEGAEIVFGTEYQLQYTWDTSDLPVSAGDTAKLQLPDVFEAYPPNTPSQPILTHDGTKVGEYTINGRELVFVFNEAIEAGEVNNGYIGINVTFDNEKFGVEWEQEIDFDGDGVKDLTVVAKPNEVDNKLEKEGQADQFNNAREITWSVDITNGNEEAITNGVLKDILPDGVGEPRDFVVREFTYDFEGNKVPGNEVEFNNPIIKSNEFELTFDNVPARGGYTVEYTTTITDRAMTEFTNNATFTAEDVNLDANTTVTIGERSNPIQKSGWYDSNSGQINWTIVVNENGEEIDHAIVHDALPPGLTIVEGSINVTKNWQPTDIEATDFPITLGKVSADEVYGITFSTEIDWSQVNEGEYQQNNAFTNRTELTDGEDPIGEDDALVDVWREHLLTKSGNANGYTYDDKVLTWTIDVNKAKHPISKAVVTDILPAGLDIEKTDIVITNEAGDPVSADSIAITSLDDGRTEVTINLGDIGTETRKITYTTEVTDFKVDNFTNEATLEGDKIGENTPGDKETVNPPGNSYEKDFESINYNAKTIDWSIKVDPIREPITALEITDTFPTKGLILLPESVVVKMGDTMLGSGDYTLVPNTEGEETGYNKGFTITLNNISEDTPLNQVITVDFTTSYDPQLEVNGNTIDDHEGNPTRYINHADFTGKTVNGHDIEEKDDAETYVREDSWNSGKKEGQLVHFDEEGNKVDGWASGSERKIAWQVYTNYQQQNLGTGVVISDTLAYEGSIDEDSIVVSVYEVSVGGETTITEETLVKDTDYSVAVDGKEFTLTFAEDFVVDERYVIEFTTSVPDISEESYTNDAIVKVGETEYPYSATVDYDKWEDHLDKQLLGQEGTEVFIGEELEWEVTVNEGLSVIRDAKITDTISAGLVYVEDSMVIKTSGGTELVKDEDYTLKVTTTDDGQTVLDISFNGRTLTEALTLNYKTVVTAEDGQTVKNTVDITGTGLEKKSTESDDLKAKQFTWVGGNYNPRRGAIKVNKVDANTGEVINTGEATFELWYELNGERVQFGDEFKTTNGVLEVGNLPLRTYYLKEIASPNGYLLSDEEIELQVTKAFNNNQANIVVADFENIAELRISVNKIWEDANNQDGQRPESITVNLLAGEEIVDTAILTATDWSATFTGLSPVDENGDAIEYTIEEVAVDGYQTTVEGSAEAGFEITNTYAPESINIAGTKTWEDADNQDGKRPDNITVRLLANGVEVDSAEVTEEDEWKYSFTDLPKFENGKEITYTIQEDGVVDYSTEINGFDITNSYTPEQTSINVVKAWDDANNQDGIRSESITVKLLADGNDTGKEVVLSDENNWQADFMELDKKKDGKAIVYTVEEVAVAGYETLITGTSEDGFIITNTHEPEVIDIAGTKTWNDVDNQDGKRPESITVRLLANGVEVDSAEVTEADEWKYSFTDLPKFENGEEINYTIQEDGVDDYSTVIDGFDITNSYTPEQTSINVVKAWNDAENQDGLRPESITVKLLADGEETDQVVVLNDANNWQADFTELDKNKDGKAIVYTVEEVAVIGYESVITGTSEDGFIITNTHEPEVIDVAGTKTWNDADNQDGKRPESITVRLLANGVEVDYAEVTEADEWKYSFADLPKFENGVEIEYTVQEEAVEGYSTEINGYDITNSYTPGKLSIDVEKVWNDADNQDGKRPESIEVVLVANGETTDQTLVLNEESDWKGIFADLDEYIEGQLIDYTIEEVAVEGYETTITGTAADGFVITNTHEPELVNVAGTKTWDDADNQDGKRPESITVKLLADGNEAETTIVNEESNWEYAFNDLPKYANGKEIEYTIEEVEVEGYETTIEGFDITNSHTPELIDITVNKTWDDADNQDGKRPEQIIVRLLADGEQVDAKAIRAEDGWQHQFTNLPKFKNGVEIVYTVQEEDVESYSTTIDGFDITNSYTPGKTSINVVKIWEDADNQDGKRPESITVKLLADGEETDQVVVLNDANNWQADFTELDVNKAGEPIVYTVEEVTVEGYDTVISGSPNAGFIITNSYEPELISVEGTKTWDDADNQDGKRPDSITVKLLANGEEVDRADVTAEDEWKYSFIDLPRFENGEEINYTVQEDGVEDYSTVIDGFDITNSYTPGKTSVNVVKIWKDKGNQDGKRPESITVKLLADGEETGQVAELSDENNWQANFTDLDVNKAGQAIEYTVEEVTVGEYHTEITGDAETGFIITNTQKTYAIGDYTWIDSNKDGIQDEDEEVLEGVKVELFDEDGNKIAETETDENGRYIFDELPAGKYQVKFTLTDEQADKYVFTKQNADENSTTDSDADPETGWTKVIELNDDNKHVTKDYKDQDFKATEGIDPTWDAGVIEKTPITPIEPAKTKVSVEKVWKGEAQDKVTINLLADGEKVDTVELTKENEWKHTFTDLPTVHKVTDEKAIEYTVEEVAVDGYRTEVTGNAKDGFIITNTQKTYAIGDYTWIDSNKDGIQDEDEEVLEGVKVELFDEDGNKIAETETDENGRYIFDELPAGKYQVKFTLTDEQADKYVFTKQNADENSTTDSDADPETGWTKVIKLNDDNKHVTKDYKDQDFKATEGIDPTWDAGVVEKTYAIGDYTWIDKNKDGIQDKDEEVLAGVTVELYDESGKKIAETKTDENGRYIFDELPAGKYKVKFTLTEEQAKKYKFTKQNAGDKPTNDSDVDETGWTIEIELNGNNKHLTKDYEDQDFKATEGIDPTWDAGVIELVDITIVKIWEDEEESSRPDKITIDLLVNGEVVDQYDLTAEAGWTLTIAGLEKFDENGVAYEYTVVEHEVKGYESAITSKGNTFTITNTFIEEEIPVDPDPETPVDPDPEKPVDPKPETPKPEEPKPTNPENPTGNGDGTLPNTATNTFNYLLIGFVLLVLGGATLFIRKRKSE